MSADTGLQRERTSLSWNRTTLSVIIVALLVVRHGFVSGQPVFAWLGAALLVGAATLVLYASRRSFHDAVAGRGVLLIAAIATLACCAGLVSIAL